MSTRSGTGSRSRRRASELTVTDKALRQHYMVALPRIEFYHQDINGRLVGPARQVIDGDKMVSTLLKQSTLDASHWEEAKEPAYHMDKWPPVSVEDILGSPAKEEECGVCDEAEDACYCDYQEWSAQMQSFWIDSIRISPAPGKGYGVFARSDIKAGEILGEYTGELVPIDKTRSNQATQYFANINIGKARMTQKGRLACRQPQCSIDATHKGSVFRFLNHACDPNAVLLVGRIGMHRRVIMIQNTKPIAKGEEITIDYGSNHFQPGESCRCGSENCRFSADTDP